MTARHHDQLRVNQAAGLVRKRARSRLRKQLADQRTLADGMTVLADALEVRPVFLDREPVWSILGWINRVCDEHRYAVMGRAGCSEFAVFGTLTDRQVEALVEALRDAARRRRAT